MVLLVIVAILGALAFFLVYLPFTRINAKGQVLMQSAREMKAVFAQNDIDLLEAKLKEFNSQYADFEKEAQSVYWMTFIPYVADFKRGVEAGHYSLKAGNEAVEAVKPYADLVGFKKGKTSFVEQSSENRLQTAILTLDKVLGKIDVISEDIKQAEQRINEIDPNRYPEKVGKTEVRSKIQNVQEQFNGVASLFVDAKPLVKRLPEMFGKDKEKTYLILFQNNYELRATGGFLTAYAVFTVKDGKIKIERSGDIYTLDDGIARHPTAPKEIRTYHKNVNQFFIRDSNLSPDLPTSVGLFNSLYKLNGERVNYDGIITIDSKVLVDMLTIFGDTEADGITFSAKEDKRCDCPQVIYQLFDMVDRPVNYVKTNRKGILGDLMYALFYKAIGFSPSKYWGTLIQSMYKNLQEKHIQLYFVDADLEKSAENLNFAGRINTTDGDYLHVNNTNFAGAKSNLFVDTKIESKTKTNDNGKVTREVMVEYSNPYPHSDCNLERGGLCLNAPLRNWVRVYVPQGSKLVDFKGSEKKVQTYDDLGKTVYEGFLTVNPLGKARITVTYELPVSYNGKPYTLMVQKQAGTTDVELEAQVDGKEVYSGILDVDKKLQ